MDTDDVTDFQLYHEGYNAKEREEVVFALQFIILPPHKYLKHPSFLSYKQILREQQQKKEALAADLERIAAEVQAAPEAAAEDPWKIESKIALKRFLKKHIREHGDDPAQRHLLSNATNFSDLRNLLPGFGFPYPQTVTAHAKRYKSGRHRRR